MVNGFFFFKVKDMKRLIGISLINCKSLYFKLFYDFFFLRSVVNNVFVVSFFNIGIYVVLIGVVIGIKFGWSINVM